MTAPTLTDTITAGARVIALTGDCSAAAPGLFCRVDDEIIRIHSFGKLTGRGGDAFPGDFDLNVWHVDRGLEGTSAAEHAADAAAYTVRDGYVSGLDLGAPSPIFTPTVITGAAGAADTAGQAVVITGGAGDDGADDGASISVGGGDGEGGDGLIILTGVPAVDPEVVGALYTTDGALMVSEGPSE